MIAEWCDADVPALVALAKLVDAFWSSGPDESARLHAEVRMASREFGLSPLSRRSLQWEIKRLAEPGARDLGRFEFDLSGRTAAWYSLTMLLVLFFLGKRPTDQPDVLATMR